MAASRGQPASCGAAPSAPKRGVGVDALVNREANQAAA